MSYDATDGKLWIGDVGGNDHSTAWEVMVGVGEAGHNFGWPYCEGPCGVGAANCQCNDGSTPRLRFPTDTAAALAPWSAASSAASPRRRASRSRRTTAPTFSLTFRGVRSSTSSTDPNGPAADTQTFTTLERPPVALRQGPGNSMFYVTWEGQVHQISFHAEEYPPIVASFESNHSAAATEVPIAVRFSTTVLAEPPEELFQLLELR